MILSILPAACAALALLPTLLATANVAAELPDDPRERDRRAILSMAGAYDVRFRFEETVACAPGYELEEPYDESAVELVNVLEDSPERIQLQHILVVGHDSDEPMIIKHWRQVWTFEDTLELRYRGHDTFASVELDPEDVRGTWTQAVFQVGDAPRYEGRGRWVHLGASSSWESEPTWRPLPRRQRHREDYQVIVARNRQTVTPAGWVHEQHNRKVVLDAAGRSVGLLAHETGLNHYRRRDRSEKGAGQAAGLEAAEAYWRGTADFWSDVRTAWGEALAEPGVYRIAGGRTINSLSGLADELLERGGADPTVGERMRDLVQASVTGPLDATATRAER